VNLTQLVLKAAVRAMNGKFKVIQGHRFWYRSEARTERTVSDKILTYILSRTVSELSRRIDQIIAFDKATSI